MKSAPDDSDEFEYTQRESMLGYGGVRIGLDGVSGPIPEPEALARAIPLWVGIPEHLETAVSTYISVMSRPEVSVRKAAVAAIGAVVEKYGRLPQESRARQAVLDALEDPSPEVSAAATATACIIRDVLG
jgi:hypothetical protein